MCGGADVPKRNVGKLHGRVAGGAPTVRAVNALHLDCLVHVVDLKVFVRYPGHAAGTVRVRFDPHRPGAKLPLRVKRHPRRGNVAERDVADVAVPDPPDADPVASDAGYVSDDHVAATAALPVRLWPLQALGRKLVDRHLVPREQVSQCARAVVRARLCVCVCACAGEGGMDGWREGGRDGETEKVRGRE